MIGRSYFDQEKCFGRNGNVSKGMPFGHIPKNGPGFTTNPHLLRWFRGLPRFETRHFLRDLRTSWSRDAVRFLSVSWARKPSIFRSSNGRSFRSQKTTVGGDVGISTENEAESSIVIIPSSHHPIIPSKRTDSPPRPEHPAWMDHPISSKGATGNCDGFIQRDPTPRPHLIAALRLEAPQKPGQSCTTLFMEVKRRC